MVQILCSTLHFGLDGFCMREKDTSKLGQADALARSNEQRRSHVFFEALYRLGQRRLRDPQFARCAPNAAGLNNGDELFELFELHGLPKAMDSARIVSQAHQSG